MWFFFRFITWEQRKLGDIGETYGGLSGKSGEDFGHGNAKFVTYMNVFTNPIADTEMTESIEIDSRQVQVKIGDVFFTTSSETPEEVGMSSVWLKNEENIYLNSFCFGYRPKITMNSYYLAYMLRSVEIREKIVFLAQGISRYNISKKKMMEITIPLPSDSEQSKLGSIFKQLDNLITLHQRKDFSMRCGYDIFLKMVNTQKMANAWEQREFNSIVKRVTEMAATDGLPRVEYEDIVSGQGTLNKDIYKKQSNKVGILFDDGDVLFGKLRPYLKNWLFAAFKGIAVGDFWVLRANNADGEYIYTLLQIDTFQNIANQATGTKMPRADWSLVSKQQFFIPRTIAEQHRIGVVFKQLDNLITLHQREHRQKKNPFLNENRSLFREAIANAWEQRKLGEVGKAQSGVGFPDREQGGKTGVPFYKVSDMNNAGNEHEMCSANNYVSEAQCKKNGWMPITEISVVFAKVGAAIMLNRKRLVRISFLLDNNTMAYKFGTEWDIDFGKTLFERIDLTDLVQIGALPSYNATDVECVEISMPDKPEQHRIGVFFKQLDNLITLHQRQLEKLKNIKSALLEKMFV